MEIDVQNNAISPQGALVIVSSKSQQARRTKKVSEGESSGAIVSLAFCDGLCRRLDQFEPAKCGGHDHSGSSSHFGTAQADAKVKPKGE